MCVKGTSKISHRKPRWTTYFHALDMVGFSNGEQMDRGLWQIVAANWDVLVSAPLAFAACAALGVLGGGTISWLILRERLAHRDDLIRYYERVQDGKLPPNSTVPARKNKMAWGLGLMIVGFAIAIGGAFLVATADTKATTSTLLQPTKIAESNFVGEPLAWNKEPLLGSQTQSNGSIQIRMIGVNGKNSGKKEVVLTDAYLLSGVTGKRLDLRIAALKDGMISIQDANPIPPGADISLSTDELNGTAGILEQDFLRDWGTIYFVAHYDNQDHRLAFERSAFEKIISDLKPKPLGPHVTKK